MDAVEIVPIAQGHIDGFHRALDIVARERRYLAFLEAPPIEATRTFVLDNIKRGHPQFVAVSTDGEVVGWCDVTPMSRPTQAHRGVFGVGLLPQFRGQGIGTKLRRSQRRKPLGFTGSS
jgi:ribosomal protein S18 acetylase RimI-like enzyme